MPRLKKKKMGLDEETIQILVQETYNDAHQIRSTLVALFNSWNGKVKEQGEIAATGAHVINVINMLSKNQEQKIKLIAVLNDIVNKKKVHDLATGKDNRVAGNNKDGEQETISEDRKNALKELFENAKKDGKFNFDLDGIE